jgi:hypothetical protein
MAELSDAVKKLLEEAAKDYLKYNSPEVKMQVAYEQGFIGNDIGFIQKDQENS